jgi:hypothetical protein
MYGRAGSVGLQVLSIQPPQGTWSVPSRREAGQVDRRSSIAHPTLFSSHNRLSQCIPAGT